MSDHDHLQGLRDRLPGPAFVQHAWTWLTGLPRSGQRQLLRWTPIPRLVTALAVLAGSLLLGAHALSGGVWWLLPVSWLLTTGAQRHLYIVEGHYAAHGAFFDSPAADRALGEALSTLSFTFSHDDFQRDHALYHHSSRLATPLDPDVRFLWRFGFGPGQGRRQLWWRLARALLSPRYHLAYLGARAASNLTHGPLYRRALGWGYLLGTLALLAWTGLWWEWLLLWFVPALGFQASALLQYLSEHRWWLTGAGGKLRTGRLTFGRFPLLAWPERGTPLRLPRLVHFWVLTLLVQLPSRLGVLVGDLVQHDLHHRRPRSDWANAAYVRQDEVAQGHVGWPEPYEGLGGTLFGQIDEVFQGWERRGPPTDEELTELERPAP